MKRFIKRAFQKESVTRIFAFACLSLIFSGCNQFLDGVQLYPGERLPKEKVCRLIVQGNDSGWMVDNDGKGDPQTFGMPYERFAMKVKPVVNGHSGDFWDRGYELLPGKVRVQSEVSVQFQQCNPTGSYWTNSGMAYNYTCLDSRHMAATCDHQIQLEAGKRYVIEYGQYNDRRKIDAETFIAGEQAFPSKGQCRMK